jgi:uroporphyrin-III C-methyltransferase
VQQNDTLFTSSIADAKQWLKKNFAENQQTENFAGELDKLAGVKLRSQYPDISNSLKLLKDIGRLRIETDKAIFNNPPTSSTTTPSPAEAAPSQSTEGQQ